MKNIAMTIKMVVNKQIQMMDDEYDFIGLDNFFILDGKDNSYIFDFEEETIESQQPYPYEDNKWMIEMLCTKPLVTDQLNNLCDPELELPDNFDNIKSFTFNYESFINYPAYLDFDNGAKIIKILEITFFNSETGDIIKYFDSEWCKNHVKFEYDKFDEEANN